MQTPDLSSLAVKLFADGADLATMRNLSEDPLIRGFTTNPTLMRKAGVHDYETFARAVLGAIPELPISFEVLSDDLSLMAGEGGVIGCWGENVYVKIPITNTLGETTVDVIAHLSESGVKVNVTAITTVDQVRQAADALRSDTPAIISVFAGRIADTGVDPMPIMAEAASVLRPLPWVELLWASPRELLNIFQAEAVGCHIITATIDILAKRHLVGKDLNQYSLETVRMFEEDSRGLGLTVAIG
jgi:transaldolase